MSARETGRTDAGSMDDDRKTISSKSSTVHSVVVAVRLLEYLAESVAPHLGRAPGDPGAEGWR